MKKFQKTKSLEKLAAKLLVFLMIFTLLPWQDIIVHAAPGDYDPNNYEVTSIIIGKTYDQNGKLNNIYIDIEGRNLRNATVRIDNYDGGQQILTPYRKYNEPDFLKFEVSGNQIVNEASFLGQRIIVGGYSVTINENDIPRITQSTRRVESNQFGPEGTLTINGTKLTNINNPSITFQYGTIGDYSVFSNPITLTDNEVRYRSLIGTSGLKNAVFVSNIADTRLFPGQANPTLVNIEVRHTYNQLFRLYEKLDLAGIEMIPNRGERGDTVYFRHHELKDAYDVFFLKAVDGTDPYTVTNRGKGKTPLTREDDKDIFTIKVPDLPVGTYYVVLTNPNTGNNPAQAVTREYIHIEQFRIIDGGIKSKIIDIQPNRGPEGGSRSEIIGQFFGTLNIDEFIPSTSQRDISTPGMDNREIVINYGPGTYQGIGNVTAVRKIRAYVGGVAQFLPKQDNPNEFDINFTKDLDRVVVRTATVNDAETNPLKDVVVEIETIFTTTTIPSTSFVVKERAQLTNGYRFIPNTITPNITGVVPEKVQVVGDMAPYDVPQGRMIAIHGSQFLIHRFTRDDGMPVMRYPRVELGNNLVIDKNLDPTIQLKVYDSTGRELDGTEGSEVGTKIVIIMPPNRTVTNLGKTFVRVINPSRNSMEMGLSRTEHNIIEFVNPGPSTNPIITSVTPNVTTTEGGEEIVISGSNFLDEVKVFIDGQEVKPINRRGDGGEIKFKAPPGREGETQIQVMNPQGNMATRAFTYVRTFTNPRIIDFSPKRGNTNTLVVVKGQNFLKPQASASEDNIMRLIGTRILLDNQDINEYNLDQNQRIQLLDYSSGADNMVLQLVNGKLQLADYFYGLILEEKDSNPKKFYTFDTDHRGRIYLSDGISNRYEIRLSPLGEITAHKEGGGVDNVTISTNSITIQGSNPLVLNFKTPYKINGDKIVGSNVRVTDLGEIHFRVPILGADGFYSLTVINPDTKRDTRSGNNGFFYYALPNSTPEILQIIPNEGSVAGGYTIDIIGKDFIDTTSGKVQVHINGMTVDPRDVVVGKGGERITVKVPKYSGDLRQEKGTNRLEVPVVLVNPDGASASKDKGFTYVVPTSNPEILKTRGVIPEKANAAGGEVVEIFGLDFRYFEPYDDTNRNQRWDQGEDYNDINQNGKWDDLRPIRLGPDITQDERELLDIIDFNHPIYNYYYSSPILPKVYFGSKQAKIVDFSSGYLKVIAPPGEAGRAEIYVLNNDAGVSNKVNFTYESSVPKIDSIIPARGTRLGGDKVEIHGNALARSEIEVYKDQIINGRTAFDKKIMPLVRFGEISNLGLTRAEQLINNNRITVNLLRDFSVEYNGTEKRVTLRLKEGDKQYQAIIHGYDDTVKYVPISMMKDNQGQAYRGSELVKIEVNDKRFLVERGYAPTVEFVSPRQLRIETPSYYTVGRVPVAVLNPDGGVAKTNFEYMNPDSRPTIIDIHKEQIPAGQEIINGQTVRVVRMNYKGGEFLHIQGTDFRSGVEVQISNLPNGKIGGNKIQLTQGTGGQPDKISFEMPNVGEGALDILHRVVVTNTDGGAAYSDSLAPPIYIIFTKGESNPSIRKITPLEGSAIGGTRVKIEGSDFRRAMAGFEQNTLDIFFGDNKVRPQDIEYIDTNNLFVRVPQSQIHGKVSVRVRNPDGEQGILRDGFTYISNPRITSVSPAKIFANDVDTEVTIKGIMFMPGAKVIIGGLTINEKDTTRDMTIMGKGINGVDQNGTNIIMAVVGGRNAAQVTVDDKETIRVKFSEAVDLKNSFIIIINPDGGISNPYDKFDYVIPVPTRPLVLEAIPGFESTVQLIWSKSHPDVLNGADKYEVYGKKSTERQFHYLGDTKDADFLIRGLEPNTQYTFMVRAMNKYGSATDFSEATVRTLSLREDDKLAEKQKQLTEEQKRIAREGKEEVVSGALKKTIGSEQIPWAGATFTIDLSLSQYKDYDRFIIAIPASVVRSSYSGVLITDGNLNFSFIARAFNTREVSQISPRDIDDSHVEITVERIKGPRLDTLRTALPRTQVMASQMYQLGFELQAGRNKQAISRMLGEGELDIRFDSRTYSTANKDKLFIGRYAPTNNTFTQVSTGSKINIQQPGTYALLSNR